MWGGDGTQVYQWYEFTPHENLILQTLHASVGLETERSSFLSLIATSGKPFQNEFHLHIMSAARRDDAYQMLFRSDWNVIAKSQRKSHFLSLILRESTTNKAKIAESQTFRSKQSRWKSYQCLPLLVCTRQICEHSRHSPHRRSMFGRHYLHSFTTVLFRI